MMNKKIILFISGALVLTLLGLFYIPSPVLAQTISSTVSFYKHAEYRKIPLTVNGVSQVPTFVCNPFNSNTNFSITSDNINWQGQHATKEEAVAAIHSLARKLFIGQ